jgi:hypothetical protein
VRKLSQFIVAVALCSVGASAARGDGLIHKLPADGAWAKFELEWVGPSPAGILVVLNTGELTLSSVGTAVVAREQCRWIEIRHVTVRNGAESVGIQKLLIPEKYLLAGLNPLDHVVKAWAQHPAVNGGAPQEITEFKGEKARPIRALTDMFYGPPAALHPLDEEVIETRNLGSLSCPGVTARFVLTRGNLESIFDYETRLHDKAPFGVVKFRSESIHTEAGVVKVPKHVTTLRLVDSGTDAVSALVGKT